MRIVLCSLLVCCALFVTAGASAQAGCGQWSVLREESPTTYTAGVWAGMPLGDPYAVEQGVEHGLVRMMGTRDQRTAFTVDRGLVRILRVRGSCQSDDAIDVVVTADEVFVVHVYGVDTGVFGRADVYRVAGVASVSRVVQRVRAMGGRALEPAVRAALSAELAPLTPR